MRHSALEQIIADIISPAIADLGIDLLWVEYKGDILSIFAENPTTGQITLAECTKISREISPLLEVEDPISGAYRLEVGSPGIDRPLIKIEDYTRFHDLEAKVELSELIDGQKKFRGFIRGVENEVIQLETDQGIVDLPFNAVYKAKLVMTDHLLKETKKMFDATKKGAEIKDLKEEKIEQQ